MAARRRSPGSGLTVRGMYHIILVEDDYREGHKTKSLLQKAISETDVRIDWLDTELAFRQWIARLVGPPPDLVVLDVRLPWTRPAPTMVPVPDGWAGNHEAGLRCYELLRKHQSCAAVPVILLTHATVSAPDGACILPKGERSMRLGEIVRKILPV